MPTTIRMERNKFAIAHKIVSGKKKKDFDCVPRNLHKRIWTTLPLSPQIAPFAWASVFFTSKKSIST